jgi:hypothetical protein
VIFLISYYVSDLRLDLVRILTAITILAAAAALFRLVAPARGSARDSVGTRLLIFFPCLTMVVSLGHWELFSVASAVNSSVVLLFSMLGVVFTGDGLRRGSARSIALGAVSALAATFSMSHGTLTWLAMAWQAAIARRPRPWLAVAFAIVGMASIPMLVIRSPGPRPPLDIGLFAQAVLVAIGTGLIGLVDNQPVPALNMAVGGVVAMLAVGCAVTLIGISAEAREQVNESSGLIVLGVLSVVALAYGRMVSGADYMASSRYAAIALPVAAGVYLFWLARPHPGSVLALPLTAALVLAGQALTNREEAKMARHRANSEAEITRLFRCAPPDDPAIVQRTRPNYIGGREFIQTGRLSIFSEPFTCDPLKTR